MQYSLLLVAALTVEQLVLDRRVEGFLHGRGLGAVRVLAQREAHADSRCEVIRDDQDPGPGSRSGLEGRHGLEVIRAGDLRRPALRLR